MDKNGDLIKGFTDASVVRGDEGAFGDAGAKTGFNVGAPVWLEGASVDKDATNSMGSVGDTGSDPMDQKFAKDARVGGSESPESVSGSAIDGGSDPMFQETPKGDGETPSTSDPD